MRAKTVLSLVLLALALTACGRATPLPTATPVPAATATPAATSTPVPTPTPAATFTPAPTATPTPKYSNSPAGAAAKLLDSWQEYDADLYLDAIVPEERQETSLFAFNEYGHALSSFLGVNVSADRPRLKFRGLRFETAPTGADRAEVAVTGFIRELNVATERDFWAVIVTVRRDGVWQCRVTESNTSFPLLNPAPGSRVIGESAQSLLRSVQTIVASRFAGAPTTSGTPAPDDPFRALARREIESAVAFRVDIIDYSSGREAYSTFWQQGSAWRWKLPLGEYVAVNGRVWWRDRDLPWHPPARVTWPSQFRRLPLLALATEDFSSTANGDWATYAPHVAESRMGSVDGVTCRVFAMGSQRDREECCFDLASHRPIQCAYTLDGAKLVATYKDWGVAVSWEAPPE